MARYAQPPGGTTGTRVARRRGMRQGALFDPPGVRLRLRVLVGGNVALIGENAILVVQG